MSHNVINAEDGVERLVWHTIPVSMRPRPEHVMQGTGKFKVKDAHYRWLFAVVNLDEMGRFDLSNASEITSPIMYAVI